ncbi:DUF3619 family protein [Massilia sp. YIM B02763]|uniref:DUF3619 family protein n=1 Tax=Massilia sp. YIM B02763 TaxID=3050130 RepID=UPI0025B632A7|nr:DUF3619 family protein [Massilia sp. YIM B02763]MDN4054414.1 DUF3619 family protein [Massilia sp. YIM B02763]
MNSDDIDLAYKIRHALNENLDNLPASTTERLAAARAQALARKKAEAPARRDERRGGFDVRALFAMPMLGRLAVVAPLVAMVAGLVGVYQAEHEQHVGELAELDAAVMSDELPLTAYTDSGFKAYLVQQEQQPKRAQ